MGGKKGRRAAAGGKKIGPTGRMEGREEGEGKFPFDFLK
jgi:hypothetical protein